MASDEGDRKLAAILSADAVGYSKLMADDERATVNTLKEYRLAIARVIERHKGRVVNSPGDNILADFPSAVEAVQAACEIQQVLKGRNLELPAERRMEFRIGVNLGDIIEESDGTIYGDGVNIAARMEALADAGGICISNTVYDAVEGKVDSGFDFLGEQQVKNIAKPVNVYRIRTDGGTKPAPAQTTAPRHWKRPAIAAAAVLAVVSIGLLVWQKTGPGPEAPAPVIATTDDPLLALLTGPSIAVLPFENLSGDSADDYFAAGLAGDIAVQLSYVQDLRIIGRSSTQKYQGTATDPRQIAEELGVQFVLVGSVRRSTETIRVTAELIDGGDGSQIWAETFDRELTSGDLFSAQDEITRHIFVKFLGIHQ